MFQGRATNPLRRISPAPEADMLPRTLKNLSARYFPDLTPALSGDRLGVMAEEPSKAPSKCPFHRLVLSSKAFSYSHFALAVENWWQITQTKIRDPKSDAFGLGASVRGSEWHFKTAQEIRMQLSNHSLDDRAGTLRAMTNSFLLHNAGCWWVDQPKDKSPWLLRLIDLVRNGPGPEDRYQDPYTALRSGIGTASNVYWDFLKLGLRLHERNSSRPLSAPEITSLIDGASAAAGALIGSHIVVLKQFEKLVARELSDSLFGNIVPGKEHFKLEASSEGLILQLSDFGLRVLHNELKKGQGEAKSPRVGCPAQYAKGAVANQVRHWFSAVAREFLIDK